MKRVLLAGALLACASANAATYQVGQYLGNLNEAARFAYNTMGTAAAHANYGTTGPAYGAIPNGIRMAGTATATIGGRAVPLTLLSRIPSAAVATAARGLALSNPATAAVTLLGFAAFNGWLTPAGLEWNSDPSTQLSKPFTREKIGTEIPDPSVVWVNTTNGQIGPVCAGMGTFETREATVYCGQGSYNGVYYRRVVRCTDGSVQSWDSGAPRPTCAPVPVAFREPISWEEAAIQLGQHAPPDPNIVPQLLQRGAQFPQPVDQTLSGPASQPGEKTTRQNADGTTTTTQTTNNYTYNQGNTTNNTTTNITHNTTTNVTIRNEAGEIVSEETETEEKDPETATDSPMPGVPELYERKYPNGLRGVWDEKIASIKTSSLFSLVPGLTPNLGDGGCPVWMLHADVGIVDFGTYDVSLPCNVWAFIRICIIVTALFLARRMIFGG